MSGVRFRSDVDVVCTRVEGDDVDIARAAWVSTKGERAADETDVSRIAGLIGFLMRDRHGSPFEQVGFQFLTSAPLFVWREHMRHRMASYNEESGRYRRLDPVFYLPDDLRPLQQVGRPGAYEFVAGTDLQVARVTDDLTTVCVDAYARYQRMLDEGIAREVARAVLPVTIYSTAYVRMNLRSLMNFLSLRTRSRGSTFPSFPQHEIELVAVEYERFFAQHYPITHAAFVANGRVAP